jgi:VanZ family protein
MEHLQKVCLLFAFITGVVIFLVSSLSFPGGPVLGISYTAVVYHFGVFFMLGFFLIVGVFHQGGFRKDSLIVVLLIGLVYAVLDELHQVFVPGRVGDLFDFWVDGAGIFMALVFVFLVFSWKNAPTRI